MYQKTRNKPLVVHISTVHSPLDPRIRFKQLASLIAHGYQGHLICKKLTTSHVPEKFIDPNPSSVKAHMVQQVLQALAPQALPDLGHTYLRTKSTSRFYRILILAPLAICRALALPAAVYHFHDPELLPWAWFLLFKRVPVIYDIHEDYTLAVNHRPWIPKTLVPPVRNLVALFERILSLPFTCIIAEGCYANRFPRATKILNYPTFQPHLPTLKTRQVEETQVPTRHLIYTGNVTKDRGIWNMVRLIEHLDHYQLHLYGFTHGSIVKEIQTTLGEKAQAIHFNGVDRYVPHWEIQRAYTQSSWHAGLVLISDSAHYRDKHLTKFFEYMAAGIPIITSNFPTWKELIQHQGAGICVNPEDPEEIAQALRWLEDHPDKATAMGERGKQLVQDDYHWNTQGKRLIQLYQTLLDKEHAV